MPYKSFNILKILIVDDDPVVLSQLKMLFEKLTAIVLTAKDGIEALEVLNNNKTIDLIVTDIHMPNLDGISFLTKTKDINNELDFILISSSTQSEHFLKAIENNVLAFILKPVDMKELVNRIVDFGQMKLQKLIIQNQERENADYINILNQIAIVSKTDLKGNITYVNDIFCEVSGYERDELIGKPHNVIRHPDMPSTAFKDLWETIKKNEI